MQSTSESARRWTWPGFLALAALIAALRPVLAGTPLGASAGIVAVAALYVLFPGWVLLGVLRRERDPPLATLMLAWALGQALLACTYVGASVLQARALCLFHPLPFLVLALVRRRSAQPSPRVPTSTADLVACLALLALAALRASAETTGDWYLHGGDAAFHAGNAAELRWHWPMQDPRIAGEPLRYHFFAYVLPCVQSLVLGTGVRTALLGGGAALLPMGFALALFATARRMGAGTALAAACSAVLLLHVDPGTLLERWTGSALGAGSPLDLGLYASPTTALGLTTLLALVYLLQGWLRDGASIRAGELVLAGMLAAGAAGSKGSVLPPLLGGLGVVLALRWAMRRERPGSAALLLAALVVGALPPTLFLLGGEASYAQSMFHLEPFAAQRMSPFHTTLSGWLGLSAEDPGLLQLALLAPLWTALFLGAGSVALVAWIAHGRRPRPRHEVVLIITAILGLIPAWWLVAPGRSQLFFAYDAQVCLLLLGAAGFACALRSRARTLLLAVFGALLALQALSVGEALVARASEELPRGTQASRGYQEALEWAARELPADAVLLGDTNWLAPCTWTERDNFCEQSAFSPRAHAGWRPPWKQSGTPVTAPFALREELQQRFLREPDRETLARIRAELPRARPLYALRDDVRLEHPRGRYEVEFRVLAPAGGWGSAVGAELVHSTPWLEVYRLPDPPR